MKIYKDEQELMNTDWQAKINAAAAEGDYAAAAQYEQARNDKITSPLYKGKQTVTSNYTQYLTGSTAQSSQPEGWTGGWTGSGALQTTQTAPAFDASAFADTRPTYTSPYEERISTMLDELMNREAFNYDPAADPLYQQYRRQYQREGQRAMKDTLAEVASGAGGMNSYAVTAAQQAGNYHSAQLADRIPELYRLAYDMYVDDYDQDVRDLAALRQLEADAYGQYQDQLADWRDDLNSAYNRYQDQLAVWEDQQERDYRALQDAVDNRYRQDVFDYQREQDAEASRQWQQSFDYKALQDAVDNLYRQDVFDYEREQDAEASRQWQQSFDHKAAQDAADEQYRQAVFAYEQQRDAAADAWADRELAMEWALAQLKNGGGVTQPPASEPEKEEEPEEKINYYTGNKANVAFDEESGEWIWANNIYPDAESMLEAIGNTRLTAEEEMELVRRLQILGFRMP